MYVDRFESGKSNILPLLPLDIAWQIYSQARKFSNKHGRNTMTNAMSGFKNSLLFIGKKKKKKRVKKKLPELF